eukprot:m.43431 g.43431  ORF g.43431 m.43431 type:complete len:471 (-) comp12925_c0_seq1:1764-3176(-)
MPCSFIASSICADSVLSAIMGTNKAKGKGKGKKGSKQKKTPKLPVQASTAYDVRHSNVLCNPRLFPAMQAMMACCHSASDESLQQEHHLESERRISNLLTAEWMPSTNKSFELLTGRVGRYTYYLYSRAEKVICEDLYGAFCVVHATPESKKSSDVTAFICMNKDVACYAYDLAAMMTQASYVLTFGASLGLQQAIMGPYRARIEDMLAFPELQRRELPNMERFSEALSKTTFATGLQVVRLLRRALTFCDPTQIPLQADALLGEEALVLCFPTPAVPDEDGHYKEIAVTPAMSERLQAGVETYNTVVAAGQSLQQSPGALPEERPVQWADLDEALKELVEHFVMCGLSYVSHLKMTHSVAPGAVDTIFTRNCVTTTVIRSSGVMQPPPNSQALADIITANASFEQFVLHSHLDNEHSVDPELLRAYIRGWPVEDMLSTISSAIATYTDSDQSKLRGDAMPGAAELQSQP